MNFYMDLLYKRSLANTSLPRCYFFNTFFYNMLSSDGRGYSFDRVRKWTTKADILGGFDLLIAPIHIHGMF